jgi:hypothetical protein
VPRDEFASDSGAYEAVTRPEAEILDSHAQILKPDRLVCEKALPFLYWMPKFHKNPTGKRFIAAASKCTTTACSKILSDLLTFVMRSLREMDNASISSSGIRRFFIVENCEEVSDFLFRWRRSIGSPGLYTGDFSTMYTSIPQEELVQAISEVAQWAFDWATCRLDARSGSVTGILHKKSGCTWIACKGPSHSKMCHTVTHKALVDWVRFVVTNTYLKNGDSIYRQSIGILYLYRYESAYVSRLAAEGRLGDAKLFHMTFRYIDDVLAVDNPQWAAAVAKPAEQGGLYPRALALSQTNPGPSEVEFLGMRIMATGARFRLSVFDKRATFPFHVRRYPLMCSLIPTNIPYGVFVGQLHRGYRICSGDGDFVSFALDVANRLLDNGCASSKLKALFKAFVSLNVRKFFKVRRTGIVQQFSAGLGNSSESSA